MPAFPGAHGAGAQVTGGRGGIVYHVTKLDRNFSHNEPGTLRYGLTDSNFIVGGQVQPRTIVVNVAGTFWPACARDERNSSWQTLRLTLPIAKTSRPGPAGIQWLANSDASHVQRHFNPCNVQGSSLFLNRADVVRNVIGDALQQIP